jgi:hypothetical protein
MTAPEGASKPITGEPRRLPSVAEARAAVDRAVEMAANSSLSDAISTLREAKSAFPDEAELATMPARYVALMAMTQERCQGIIEVLERIRRNRSA